MNQFCRNASLAELEAHKLLLAEAGEEKKKQVLTLGSSHTGHTGHRQLQITCTSLTHSSPVAEGGFRKAGASQRRRHLLFPVGAQRHTESVPRPTATPSSLLRKVQHTCLKVPVPTSLPQFPPTTLQSPLCKGQKPRSLSSCARAAAALEKKGRIQKQTRGSF